MKNYSIDFYRDTRKGRELEMRMEFPRERFSAREFKDYLLATLFELACEGIHNKLLCAVLECDGEKVLTVYCDTKVGGSEINAIVKAARPREKFRTVRVMNIAC